YDILGRQVISISPGLLPAGRHQQILNMQRFASGVYFAEIRINTENNGLWRAVQPMTLIK
ncbi:MAG: T9SS type A sorting domain-containing protein, partial [Balneolales bacterium]|nr:T9SS type A sorting domain-containing protein [Balneolales bacterium]